MYDQAYVNKRRKRKIAALVALFSAIGVTALVIVAFLGRTVGTFTISLKNTDVSLTLCEKINFKDTSSYLNVKELKGLREDSFEDIISDKAMIDSETTPSNYGKIVNEKGEYESLRFIKYTFYVTNVGKSTAEYNLSVNITDRTESNDETPRSLDDTLRVMIFENDPNDLNAEDPHKYRVFAKEAWEYENKDINGVVTNREFVSKPTYDLKEDKDHPLAESFISSKTVAKYNVQNFKQGDVRRYTIVLWLEGYDPQSKPDDEYPEGATIKLGVNIAAYENVENN